MSDGFQPALVADQAGPANGPVPDNPPTDPLVHLAAIADDIVAGFRHIAAVVPSAAPLARYATSIANRLALMRADLAPPPVEGPQQDHS